MDKFLLAFGLYELVQNEEKKKELVEHIKKNNSIVLDGFNYEYTNAYSNKDEEFGVQFVLEKNKENESENLLYNHTNSCVWDFKIVGQYGLNLDKNFYLIDSDIYGELEKSNSNAVIQIINKDILPSVLPNDILKVQVSGIVKNISFFSTAEEQHQHFRFLEYNSNTDKALITPLIDTSSRNDNIKLVDHVGIAGIVQELYCYEAKVLGEIGKYFGAKINTKFGDLMLYFSEEQICYCNKGSFKVGSIVECTAYICGDAYLKRDLLNIELNYENNFRLFRRAFTEENFNIFEPILDENCEYKSKKYELKGKENILNQLNLLANEKKVNVRMNKVVIIKKSPEIVDNDLKIGDECLHYTQEGSTGQYLSFIKCNKDNKIISIEMHNPSGYGFTTNFPKKYIDELVEEEVAKQTKKINKSDIYNKIVEDYFDKKMKEESERRNPTNIFTATEYFIRSLAKEYIAIDELINNGISANLDEFKNKSFDFIMSKSEELKLEFCRFNDRTIIMAYGEEKPLRDELLFINCNFIEFVETNMEYYKMLKDEKEIENILKKKQEYCERAKDDITKLQALYEKYYKS